MRTTASARDARPAMEAKSNCPTGRHHLVCDGLFRALFIVLALACSCSGCTPRPGTAFDGKPHLYFDDCPCGMGDTGTGYWGPLCHCDSTRAQRREADDWMSGRTPGSPGSAKRWRMP